MNRMRKVLGYVVLSVLHGVPLMAAVAVMSPQHHFVEPTVVKQPRQQIAPGQLQDYKELLERNIAKLRVYLAKTSVPPQERAEQSVRLQKATDRLDLVHRRMSMLPETAQIAQGTRVAETPAEKRIEKLLLSDGVRPNQFQVLLATKNLYELFGDSALAKEFSFAMGDIASVQHMIMIRRGVLPQWRAWNPIVLESGKEAVERYAKLYEEVVHGLKNHYPKRSAALAHIAIKAPLADSAFSQEMVRHIAGSPGRMIPTYGKLRNLILGYDFSQSEYHRQPSHKVGGKHINDIQCAWQVFGKILIAYREEYCQRYLTGSEMFAESFSEQWGQRWPSLNEWVMTWKQQMFIDPLEQQPIKISVEQKEAYDLWRDGIKKAGIQAHSEAHDSMNTMLAEILQAMRSIHARLDILSVGDAAFSYPYPGARSHELDPASMKSILIGSLHGCVEQRLVLRRALTPSVIHEVFHREMMSQTSKEFKHVAQLPKPVTSVQVEKANKEAQEGNRDVARETAARIRAYQARRLLTISSPTMDIMTAESDQEDRGFFSMGDRYVQVSLAEELRFFNVPLGMQLYASVLDLYGELNAIRWGLNTLQTRQQVIAKLVQKLHLVAEYLRAMGEPVAGASDEKLMQRYNVIIREMIPWKKLKNIPYAKVVSLREQLADDSITHEQRQGSYRSAYRLMWICIWYNLKRLVSRNGNQHTVPVPGDMPVAEVAIVPKGMNIPVAAVVEKEGEVLEAESALKKLKQQFGETVDVFDPIISGVGSDVDAIRSELLGTFKDTGDYSGVVNNANRMLGRIGSILPSFNGMMLQAYGHTDNLFGQMKDHSDRLLASMKGMMLYGYWLNRYTDTKIKGLQEMLSELLNSTLLQIGMKFPPVRKKLVRAMQHVSENDQGVLKQMRSAREKARLGWEGKLRADEIPSIPQAKVRL